MDHLNEEAVGNHVERFWDIHRYDNRSARGLSLVKTETILAEIGSMADVIIPRASTMVWKRTAARWEKRPCCWDQLPCSCGFPAFSIGMMTELFQIAGMSTPATERLKSFVRKAMSWGPRWCRWSMESPSGPWAVEEPAFLMAAVTPLSSIGITYMESGKPPPLAFWGTE